MFSQHPDHAARPFWHNKSFISTQHELEECLLMFKEMGAEEVMWDWEGKLVDESVIERFLGGHLEFFKKKPLGKELFLTFRVPNPRIESGYRLGRAFMVILSARHLARSAAYFTHPPLFEIILPMTESAKEILHIQNSFQRIAKAAHYSFGSGSAIGKNIEVIPIFESVGTILKSGKILYEYVKGAKSQFGKWPLYIRPFCARSDPALNSGIVPTTLAIKWALSEYAKFTRKTGIITYPIIAPGALPFRGGLTPAAVKQFLGEFPGIKTLVIQSAFRYDYPLSDVKKAVKEIVKKIPELETEIFPSDILGEIQKIIAYFETPYKETVEKMVPIINRVSNYVPQRRERAQHTGLFGYSRNLGKHRLPRAIGFTASCYSLGIPPEFIGIGRGLKAAKERKKIKVLENLYRTLKPALLFAGRYLRKESIKELGLKEIAEDIGFAEEYLGDSLGPRTIEECEHSELVSKIIFSLKRKKNPEKEMEKAAILRRSVG